MSKRVMIFYARAGNGHLAYAKALKAELIKQNSNLEVELVNPFENSLLLHKSIEEGYAWMVSNATWLWALIYFVSDNYVLSKILNSLLGVFCGSRIRQIIKTSQPDLIINTYYFASAIARQIELLNLKTPLVTVCTDPFTFHKFWLLETRQLLYLLSNKAYNQALKSSFPKEKLQLGAPIVDSKFEKNLNSQEMKKIKSDLGIVNDYSTVLIVGGADGLPNSYRILRKLIQINRYVNIIIVCGKNITLETKCNKVARDNKDYPGTIVIKGFTNQLFEYMNVVDLVVTKGGAGVIFECIAMKKPVISTMYLYKQELGNVQYIVENGLGKYEPNINKIGACVTLSLKPEKLEMFKQNYEKLEFRNGVGDIVQQLISS